MTRWNNYEISITSQEYFNNLRSQEKLRHLKPVKKAKADPLSEEHLAGLDWDFFASRNTRNDYSTKPTEQSSQLSGRFAKEIINSSFGDRRAKKVVSKKFKARKKGKENKPVAV